MGGTIPAGLEAGWRCERDAADGREQDREVAAALPREQDEARGVHRERADHEDRRHGEQRSYRTPAARGARISPRRAGGGSTRRLSRARRTPPSSTTWRSRCSSGRRTPSRRRRAGRPSGAPSCRRASRRTSRRRRGRARRRPRRGRGRAPAPSGGNIGRSSAGGRRAPARRGRRDRLGAPLLACISERSASRSSRAAPGRAAAGVDAGLEQTARGEPVAEALDVVEQVGAVLAVDRVDEHLHQREPSGRRLAAARMDRPAEQRAAFHRMSA